jgi:predicted sugar kinase
MNITTSKIENAREVGILENMIIPPIVKYKTISRRYLDYMHPLYNERNVDSMIYVTNKMDKCNLFHSKRKKVIVCSNRKNLYHPWTIRPPFPNSH